MSGAKYDYRDLSGRTRWLAGLICLLVVTLVISGLLEGELSWKLDSRDIGNVSALARGVQIATIFTTVILLIVVVMFLAWVYRASANVHAMGAQNLSYGAGFSVGTFFIPGLNAVLPVMMMREVWQASVDAGGWRAVRVNALVYIWWALQICGSIGGVSLMFVRSGTLEEVSNLMILGACYRVLEIAHYAIVFILTRRIAQNQIAQQDMINSF